MKFQLGTSPGVLALALVVVVMASSLSVAGADEAPRKYRGDTTSILSGSLGFVSGDILGSLQGNPSATIKNELVAPLTQVLMQHMGFSGTETIQPTTDSIDVDPMGNYHARFQQYLNGYAIEGTAIMLHVDGKTGAIYGVNGEAHSSDSIIETPINFGCKAAMEIALEQYGITDGEWMSDCVKTAVQAQDGTASLAYRRLLGFQPSTEIGDAEPAPYQKNVLFASPTTGNLLAVFPQVWGARSMETYDCENNIMPDDDAFYTKAWFDGNCEFITNSSGYVNTSDEILNRAHNFAVDVYDFYLDMFNRDSMDGKGQTIKTFVHFNQGYNNAFYDNIFGYSMMVYGDGDGILYRSFVARDVVTHELSHGVTAYTSNMTYYGESGALNEGFSDVMASSVDWLVGKKSVEDTWTVAEDVVIAWKGLRTMANPMKRKDPDYYPERYRGLEDYAGVHMNSGIYNLAFVLMTGGGKHPRGKTDIQVDPLNTNFTESIKAAATIFYYANTMCLTPSSTFQSILYCTLTHATAEQQKTVRDAWAAVGVTELLALGNGITQTGWSLATGEVQEFMLDATVLPGQAVKCAINGSNGDADLFVRLGDSPEPFGWSTLNDCSGYRKMLLSKHTCQTGPTLTPTNARIMLSGYSNFTGLSIECHTVKTCKVERETCTARKDCCVSKTTELTCSSRGLCRECKKAKMFCSSTVDCCNGLTCTNRRCKQ